MKFLIQYQNWTHESCDAVIYTDMDYHLRTVGCDLALRRVFERERERERGRRPSRWTGIYSDGVVPLLSVSDYDCD